MHNKGDQMELGWKRQRPNDFRQGDFFSGRPTIFSLNSTTTMELSMLFKESIAILPKIARSCHLLSGESHSLLPTPRTGCFINGGNFQ